MQRPEFGCGLAQMPMGAGLVAGICVRWILDRILDEPPSGGRALRRRRVRRVRKWRAGDQSTCNQKQEEDDGHDPPTGLQETGPPKTEKKKKTQSTGSVLIPPSPLGGCTIEAASGMMPPSLIPVC